ncbi:NAD(P)-dependent oxidoreductase [Pseudomonadales bacterium]|nr:NAD(P)-dependent oxidoreductase [Pseudomonadales bacterium]
MADSAKSKNFIGEDCLKSLELNAEFVPQIRGQRLAVIGGTGFIGSWIAELVTLINDKYAGNIRLDLIGRSANSWQKKHPHLQRDDITVRELDVRSPFALADDTTLVIYAAAIADPRVHSSDPYQVYQTNVNGIDHALNAATRLPMIHQFVNVSSGLAVSGPKSESISERSIGVLDFTRIQNIYAETRRSAEAVACIYASQYRMPVVTTRAFTFIGPYQSIDAPWALNNFIRDALYGHDIRILGDGSTRRSYLYGSDAAVWLLKIAVSGQHGEVYNIGGESPISHADVANEVASLCDHKPRIVFTESSTASSRTYDFFPDVSFGRQALGLRQAFSTKQAIQRAMQWHGANIAK